MSGDLRISWSTYNRVKFIAKIGMKACTQSSRHLFRELFATDKPNYVTLSYKYNSGIQPE